MIQRVNETLLQRKILKTSPIFFLPPDQQIEAMALRLIFLQLAVLVWAMEAAAELALPGCASHCGNTSIPYPFGITPECYLNQDFLISCNLTTHQAFLQDSTIVVLNISVSGQLRVMSSVASICYNESGGSAWSYPWMRVGKFRISHTRNKFMTVGCDTYAFIEDLSGKRYKTGCLSLCESIDSVINGSCSGIGCCQTTIPVNVSSFNITVDSYNQHRDVLDFNPCSFAFVAEDGYFNFSSTDLRDLRNEIQFPTVLDWSIGNETCDQAKENGTSYACKDNSDCYDPDNGPGYRCNCSEGYEGNPYLVNGCKDINECEVDNPCNVTHTCRNLPGNYTCSCPAGYEGDGKKDGTGCSLIPSSESKFPLVNVALGLSISLLVLLLMSSWLYWGFRQRKLIKLKEKFFEQNGGIMLQQLLSKREGFAEATKIFTVEDLKKATNNYDEKRILGRGGQGTVYKGILADNRVVAVKKSKIIDQSQVESFINEVIILSQVNHRNVVKLLGCCLETEVPLLVYEFVTNGTLYNHLHNQDHASSFSWETRLRIATETAGALWYLHSVASTPIIHRDVKSTNILLDNNYTAKVSDFGASRLIPLDQAQLTTLVQGTLGYLDPEYFHSSQLTEKSDVYSFGVVLVELLTGKKALSFDKPEEERNLAMFFVSSMKDNRLFEILDDKVLNEGNANHLKEVAILAKRCLIVKGEERPTMKEVAMELEGLRILETHPWVNNNSNLEETEYLIGQPQNAYEGDNSNIVGYDSIRDQVITDFNGGR